jgi:exosortase/archaeosortase family protein
MFLGEYMVGVSANLTRLFLDILGIVVFWDGNVASFTSKTGESFRLVIDAGCSSIPAISIFLLLSGLMHLDQRKGVPSTIKLAFFGTLSLILLNSLKVSIVIWAGKAYGSRALWSLHSWLGYVFFSMFYLVTLLVDLRLRYPRGGSAG